MDGCFDLFHVKLQLLHGQSHIEHSYDLIGPRFDVVLLGLEALVDVAFEFLCVLSQFGIKLAVTTSRLSLVAKSSIRSWRFFNRSSKYSLVSSIRSLLQVKVD